MKAVRFTGVQQLEYGDVPKPQLNSDEVLIRVKAVGVCGSDMELFSGEHNYLKRGVTKYPLIPGHEWAGQIEEIGSEVTSLKVGDRVTGEVSLGCGCCEMCKKGRFNLCPNRGVIGSYKNRDGAFAEYIKIHYKDVHKLPDNISYEEAAMVEPAATSAYGVIKGKVEYGDTVLVIGDGPIGQLAMQCAKAVGGSKVFVVGSWDEKLEIAKQTGADELMNYKKDDVLARVSELTDGVGVDVVIESSGNPKTVNQSLQAIKPGGRVILLSLYTAPEFMAEINTIVVKDAEVTGVLASPNAFKPTIALMESGKINVKPLITHKFPLEKAMDAIETIKDRSQCTLKVLLIP